MKLTERYCVVYQTLRQPAADRGDEPGGVRSGPFRRREVSSKRTERV